MMITGVAEMHNEDDDDDDGDEDAFVAEMLDRHSEAVVVAVQQGQLDRARKREIEDMLFDVAAVAGDDESFHRPFREVVTWAKVVVPGQVEEVEDDDDRDSQRHVPFDFGKKESLRAAVAVALAEEEEEEVSVVVVASSSLASWHKETTLASVVNVVAVLVVVVVSVVDSASAAAAAADDDVAPLIFSVHDMVTDQSFLDSIMGHWMNAEALRDDCHRHQSSLLWCWLKLLLALLEHNESNPNFPRCQSWENGLDDRWTSVLYAWVVL
jgi:hypothetical protein